MMIVEDKEMGCLRRRGRRLEKRKRRRRRRRRRRKRRKLVPMTADMFGKGDVMISKQRVMEEKRKKFGVELSGLVVT